ncbi:hypothetical protein GCM10028778_24130 [Barrientosiimonas marina]|uniref:Uncharacterized protein n=1 Tax=Lentibacillus kimchii TaxID=1542911 RepID=A0ABW2UZC5_9BACI
MQKALITFVVLAIILIVFFVVLEYAGGGSAASANFGDVKAMAETTADFLKPAA